MDAITDLKRDLSMGLQDDVDKQLAGGENIVVSLPGSFGEALVVTDRRALIVRERDSAYNAAADIYSYALSRVRGAEAMPSATGGYIELKLSQLPAEPDHARVYFPSYELARFQAAAAYISQIAQGASAEASRAVSNPESSSGVTAPSVRLAADACPGCGAGVGDLDVFCAHCGVQLRATCMSCGNSSPMEAEYCVSCGEELVHFKPDCPRCAGRVSLWMSFCPQCGSTLGGRCASCGVRIIPDWAHCPSCGRRLGSDTLDASAARSLQRRLQAMKDTDSLAEGSAVQYQEPVERSEQQPILNEPQLAGAGDAARAKMHNNRGQQCFENDDFEGAIAEFQAAVRLDPQNATYHCNLAVALDEADRDEEALIEYEKTLQLDPNDLTALLSLGYMYNENFEMEKAQEVWQRVLNVAPDSAEAQEVRDNLRHQEEL